MPRRAAGADDNHVERTNRMFRFLEKVRYKWRRRRTLVRFVVLRLDDSGVIDRRPRLGSSRPSHRVGAVRRKRMQANNHGEPHEDQVEISEESRFCQGLYRPQVHGTPAGYSHGGFGAEHPRRPVRVGGAESRI